jgi:hypothetical protein
MRQDGKDKGEYHQPDNTGPYDILLYCGALILKKKRGGQKEKRNNNPGINEVSEPAFRTHA